MIEIVRTVGLDAFLWQACGTVRVLEKYKDDPDRAQAWVRAMAVMNLRAAGSGKLTRRSPAEDVIIGGAPARSTAERYVPCRRTHDDS